MSNRNLVIILQNFIAILFENDSNSYHSQSTQFGCTKGPDACAAEYVDSPAHRPQDLFMSYRWQGLEVAVDDSDCLRTLQSYPINIAFGGRRQIHGFQFRASLCRRNRRAGEDVNAHGFSAMTPCARRPGT